MVRMMKNYDCVVIISPGFEQRVSKMAYSFLSKGLPVTVIAQDRAVSNEYKEYVEPVNYIELPKQKWRLNSLPFGKKRSRFITSKLKAIAGNYQNILVVARDVTYGYIVGKIIKCEKLDCTFVIDIADNFDLFYDSCANRIIRMIMKYGYKYIQKKALRYANKVIVVSPNNISRLRTAYKKLLDSKSIHMLRNLPITDRRITPINKIDNTMVYVGRVDEISRDLFSPLLALKELQSWSLHLYSNEKKATLDKLMQCARENNFDDRVIIHERVPYTRLLEEVSQYTIGLVTHKRNLLTDYTIPNKIYDYRSAGVVSLMSDNPSLIEENNLFGFGVIYHDNIINVINKAVEFEIDYSVKVPTWTEEFDKLYSALLQG